MTVLISLLIVLVIVCLACWLISVLPVPNAPFPIKTILYVIVIALAIVYLMRLL